MKMNKILAIAFAAIMPLAFTACDSNDPFDRHDGWNGGDGGGGGSQYTDPYQQSLTQTERNLVGSYVTDDPKQLVYLVLNENRTGSYDNGTNAQSFKWYVHNDLIITLYDDTKKEASHEFYYSHNHLYVDGAPYVLNTQTDNLNQYEKKLVGSYVSDDNASSVFYLTLYSDRTGFRKIAKNGQSDEMAFTWSATSNTICVKSSNGVEYLAYSFTSDHLYVDNISLVADNSQQSTSALVAQWQGSLASAYYSNVWGVTTGNLATVLEFTADGKGTQLDYDTSSPRDNFAFSTFTWTEANGTITMKYLENETLTTATTSNYALTRDKFSGQLTYTGHGAYSFSLASTSGFDWTPYLNMLQTRAAATFLRQLSQEGATPKQSGTFARK